MHATVQPLLDNAGDLSKPAPCVRVQDVRFRWPGSDRDVLRIAALDVAAGERLFIAGPSGSGKSTLLNLLGGVVTADAGTVEVLGQDLGTMPGRHRDRFRAEHVGFVFQMFNLVPYLSLMDNVTLPCRFSTRRRERARGRSGTEDDEALRLLAALDLDDADLRGRAVTDLSIGQQQRVAVARALMGAPELLIADEPTSALDEGTRQRFLELLFRECAEQSTTVLFVSHDPRLGPLFDRQLQLTDVNQCAGDGVA